MKPDRISPYLSFKPQEPRGLETPSKILVETWVGVTAEDTRQRSVALMYESQTYGRVVVLQSPAQASPAEFAAFSASLVAKNDEPQVTGRAETILLMRSLPALITMTDTREKADIQWLAGGVEFRVLGPTLTRDQVVRIAENF